ncbi:MAG: M14 family metallopeptidase [Bacteroidota bacterium]
MMILFNQQILKWFIVMTLAITISVLSTSFVKAQKIPAPTEHFGFYPGTDKMLFDYESLISYLKKLDEASDNVTMQKIGISPMGKPMYVMFISSAKNIQNLDKLKEINKELALNPDLTAKEQQEYIHQGKVFFLFTLSMHSNEVAPSQALPLIAYELITSADDAIQKQLNDVVYMVVPNHNPDGMNMIVNHYNKYKDTKYDGSSMPGVYHKYVGHDNNRDFVALTQSDTRAISRFYSKEWFPQVMVEKHQMGSTGPRYYVAPPHDPIAENIDAGIWNWMKIFGSRTVTKMTEEGLAGVTHSYLFDDYWPGSTETCIWKNVIGMLTEAASVKYATPIYIESNELQAYGKGISEYKKSINMPDPWEGGWWRLSDLIKYEISSTKAYLETASIHKKEILKFRNDLCKKEVEKGKNEPPYYYIFPKDQHDQSELVHLVNLLNEHGINVYELNKNIIVDQTAFNKGDIIIPLAQPFRAFIKEMLESQVFPARHYTPGGEMIKPYDITSWSLPLHKGVKVFEINQKKELFENSYQLVDTPYNLFDPSKQEFNAVLLTANHNNSYQAVFAALKKGNKVEQILENYEQNGIKAPKGSFIVYTSKDDDAVFNQLNFSPVYLDYELNVKTKPVNLPRIALIESYFHPMDAGWTRYVFDTYNIPFTVLNPDEIKDAKLSKDFDVIVIPDEQKSVLVDGKYKSENRQYFMKYPPEYLKGMEKEGYEKLLKFIHDGGKAIAWRSATELFCGMQSIDLDKNKKEDFEFPVKDISSGLIKAGFSSPGSLLKIQLDTDHPITYGMPEEVGVFHRSSPVFTTWQPYFDVDRRVIGTFPERNILMSGYADNEEKVGNKTSIVWLKKGKGQVVLFSFNPQFRASTPATYKLLFNSILL